MQISQIDLGYRYSALAIANALMSEVGAIFPQHMILIYLTTSHKRRQVWHAYIAAMFANPANPQPITDPDAVRHKLMHASSKELVQEAYGSVPSGFLTALNRLGLNGEEPRVYLLMHKFISENKNLQKALSHTSKIKASTIITLSALPKQLQNYDLVKQIKTPEDIKTLTFMIDTLARGDNQKYIELCEMVVTAASRNHSVSAVLKREYYLTPFPVSLIPNSEFCKHVANAFELQKMAKKFQNCLGDYCSEAIRSEYIFYQIFEKNRPTAIVSLRNDHPFSWRIYEIQGPLNEYIEDELEQKIIAHFESHGVFKMSSMEALLRELCMLNHVGRRNPVDDINDVIDELLDGNP